MKTYPDAMVSSWSDEALQQNYTYTRNLRDALSAKIRRMRKEAKNRYIAEGSIALIGANTMRQVSAPRVEPHKNGGGI